MKPRLGVILLSVVSLLAIGTAFEVQRYANFRERQTMYRLMIESFEHPEQTVDAVTSAQPQSSQSRTSVQDDLSRQRMRND